MPEVIAKYDQRIIDRAIELYNKEVEGHRVYRVEAIPAMLKEEFPGKVKNLSRATIYLWLNRYDRINYRIRREEKTNA